MLKCDTAGWDLLNASHTLTSISLSLSLPLSLTRTHSLSFSLSLSLSLFLSLSHTHTHTLTHTRTHTRTHAHAHIHTQPHTNTRTHTRSLSLFLSLFPTRSLELQPPLANHLWCEYLSSRLNASLPIDKAGWDFLSDSPTQSASKREGNNLTGLKDFYLNAKARIWP